MIEGQAPRANCPQCKEYIYVRPDPLAAKSSVPSKLQQTSRVSMSRSWMVWWSKIEQSGNCAIVIPMLSTNAQMSLLG
jgi:hypothetical protein